MEGTRKWKKLILLVISCATTSIVMCSLPCVALEVPTPPNETETLNIDYTISESVTINSGGTVNLLDGGKVGDLTKVTITIIDGGTLNIKGGLVNGDIVANSGGTVNISGGDIIGNNFGWDIILYQGVNITVFGQYFKLDDVYEYYPPNIINDATAGIHKLSVQYVEGWPITDLMFYLFYSNIPITLEEPSTSIEVQIDIKPGSYPNSVNINGNGVIPVAVLGSADFDVTQIELYDETLPLTFNGLAVRVKGNGQPQCSIDDVSGPEGVPDGFDDLVCQFVDDTEQWLEGDDIAEITGFLVDGTPFAGSDEITVVP